MGYLILPRRDEIAIGRVLVMRSLLVLFLAILLPPAAYATVMADEGKIRTLLKSPKSWTMYLEFTDAPTPSDRAQKFVGSILNGTGDYGGDASRPWRSATA